MTDSENSQPQDDSDEDIYKDIPEFNFEDELAKLEGSKETYKQEANDLSEKVKVLTEENRELKNSNEVLKKNLSTLLKTAQAEIKRKDSQIQELRTQVESITFRRNKTVTKDKYTSTDDLEFSNINIKFDPEKHRSVSDAKRAKSYENRISSNSERRSNQDKEKRKETSLGKEENANCDTDRNSAHPRGNSKTNFKHSDSQDRHREKSSRYEDNCDYRRSYRDNHRSHIKSDSYDKNRHSRSSENRFLSQRRYSRERRTNRGRGNSSERRRSSERSRRRKERSCSREVSRGSKEPSLEKPKLRSSLDKDSIIRNKEPIGGKSETTDGGKSSDGGNMKKGRMENPEKPAVQDVPIRNKQNTEKKRQKNEKRGGLDIFSSKSPLDALYNEMVTSRSSNRFSGPKSGTTDPESDVEEGELPNSHVDTSESQPEEDWTLSFKNERQNDPKPMTLYSRRMMQKFSSEVKSLDSPKSTEEKPVETKKQEKTEEVEKEPGELTDDENIVESSKEFQELTKVASIEMELKEKSVKEKTVKEPIRRDSSELENGKPEIKEVQKELEKPNPGREDPNRAGTAEEQNKEVVEFSPFKNNYKLIEISPIKPTGSEHILDYYHQRLPPAQPAEQTTLELSELVTESEKSKQSDTSEEKNSEAELKIVLPPVSESRQGKETKPEGIESIKKKDEEEEKKPKDSKQEELGRGKRKPATKKEPEKPTTEEKSQKRKRKSSERAEGKSDSKRRKMEKNEPSRKSSRSKSKPEPEEYKPENKINEDISSFEFFKPATKQVPQTPVDPMKSVCTTTDYKMTATMSVTGVVRLETPDKCMEKLKNLMLNEHMIFNVLDSKNHSQFSPIMGSKCIEMTPRRMLKNDLMLTDSEDDSVIKKDTERGEEEEEEVDEEEAAGEEEDESSGSDNSECDSDSGASDFVDLL